MIYYFREAYNKIILGKHIIKCSKGYLVLKYNFEIVELKINMFIKPTKVMTQ